MRIKLERRLQPSQTVEILTPVISLILALAFGAVILALTGVDPLRTYRAMALGAMGDLYNVSETVVKAIPLILCGLAVAIAFRMRFWNIGAEGQLAMGAFATVGLGLYLPDAVPGIPRPGIWILMLIGGFAAGALWGVIPAALRAFIGVNEVISTLMLNYVAILWLEYLYTGPWRDPSLYGLAGTAIMPSVGSLPRFFGTRLHAGLFIALAAVLVIAVLLGRTRWGYEIRVLGENAKAARYAGISVARNMLLLMLVSGGLAGLAGMSEVAGVTHSVQMGFMQGYGFTAIIVAWMARLNPFGVVLVAVLLAALLVGGDQIQLAMRLPASVASVLQGAILFCMLGGALFTRYRLRVEPRRQRPVSKPQVEVQA